MKVLMVVHKHWWEKKCPPCWPLQFQALKKVPGLEIAVTGPKWQDYDSKASLRSNVERIMPRADVLYLWRPFGIVEFEGYYKPGDELLPQLKVSAYQDDPRLGVTEAKRAGLDLLFYRDHWDRQFFDGCGVRSVYLPLAVDLSMYGDWEIPHVRRPRVLLLTGNTAKSTYPLRFKVQTMIKRGQLPGGFVRRRSPYRYTNISAVMDEQKSYAANLCMSRISLVSSCPHIPLTLRKYFESLAAGCLLVGDLPNSPPADVQGRLIQISHTMTEDLIRKTLMPYLVDEKRTEQYRLENRKVAENYSYPKFAERWVKAVTESLELHHESSRR